MIDKDILNQKYITTLGDMINLMNNGSKSFNPCRTLAKVIDSQELKKEYLTGFILGIFNGHSSKLLPLVKDFKNLLQTLFNQGKIDKYELNALNDSFEKTIKQIIEYLSKSNFVIIEF